ncbi:MAG: metal ABC transporter permease [Pseudomonadota bacterium]
MIAELLVPFSYAYMVKAIAISMLVGATCAFLSAYLMLKGWSLMGDALAHAVVPGVAGAYVLGLPFAAGAFIAGLLAAAGMFVIRQVTRLREDAIIGLVFTAFFAAGLFIASIYPTSVSVQTIIMGNVLAIPDAEALQVTIICFVCLLVLAATWRDLMLIFFDEGYARTTGLRVDALKIMFFALLAAATVAALQTVGAFLVIAMVVTPGATAYLLTDRFGVLLIVSVALGAGTAAIGAYVSFFLDGATGGLIVCLQTLVFLAAFVFAPKHGLLAGRRAAEKKIGEAQIGAARMGSARIAAARVDAASEADADERSREVVSR